MLPTRDPPQNKRPIQTESEGLETNVPSKWTGKTKPNKMDRVAILISDKIDFKKKAIKRHRRTPYNTSRRHKHYKHICTQHRRTKIYKENLRGLQERYRQPHTYTRGF